MVFFATALDFNAAQIVFFSTALGS
ncbi:uncharacterized protein G2W53_005064 [Senna tora]|uniref:Uncharacterized protein n=1 Tax=Senna tora TaxID=362788 RepID=A0A834XEZ1_9FABA|nr:uncharacterized protein G2W53_005064 [Senna tora]